MDEVHKPERYVGGGFSNIAYYTIEGKVAIPYNRVQTVEVEVTLEGVGRPRVRIVPSDIEHSLDDLTLFTSGAKQVIVTYNNVSYIYELESDIASKPFLLPLRHMLYRKVNSNI